MRYVRRGREGRELGLVARSADEDAHVTEIRDPQRLGALLAVHRPVAAVDGLRAGDEPARARHEPHELVDSRVGLGEPHVATGGGDEPTVLESPPCWPVMMLRLPELACQSSGDLGGAGRGNPSSFASYRRPASMSKLGTGPAVGPPGLNEHWLAIAAMTRQARTSGMSDQAISRASFRMRGFSEATRPV